MRGNKLVITYWSFNDALVQNYTLPYVRMIARNIDPGSRIFLVTLDRTREEQMADAGIDRVVHVGFRYMSLRSGGFFMVLRVIAHLLRLIKKERIDGIHAWCTPAGALGYILSLFTGRPLVIDSYEPHAEAMVEIGTWRNGGLPHRILLRLEKAQTHRATHLIAAAAGMKEYAREKYGYAGPMFVKPACVDLELFSNDKLKDPALLNQLGLEGRLVAVYAGKFGGIYLDQEVFDLLKVAYDHWGEVLHVLLLTPHTKEALLPMMNKAGLPPEIFTVMFVPHAEIPRYMGLADLAITPVRPVPTKRYCTPVKNGEYWALGLPVIITRDISDDSDIIRREGIGSVLEGLDRGSYERSVLEIDRLLKRYPRAELYDRIREVARRYRNFDRAEEIYRKIYGKR